MIGFTGNFDAYHTIRSCLCGADYLDGGVSVQGKSKAQFSGHLATDHKLQLVLRAGRGKAAVPVSRKIIGRLAQGCGIAAASRATSVTNIGSDEGDGV